MESLAPYNLAPYNRVRIQDVLKCSLLAAASLWTQTSAIALPSHIAPSRRNIVSIDDNAKSFVNYAAEVNGHQIERSTWNVFADGFGLSNEANLTVDGSQETFWHADFKRDQTTPQTITIDLQTTHTTAGLTYLPRQDGKIDGNIEKHRICVSTNGNNFVLVAYGTFYHDNTLKSVNWEPTLARYVRIRVMSTAGNQGPSVTAAEFHVFEVGNRDFTPAYLGRWGPTINFPLVPVAAAVEPLSSSLLTWSSYTDSTFTGGNGGRTLTSTLYQSSEDVEELLVTNTDHDMFCPGLSTDFNGRQVVTGGNDDLRTSFYDPKAQAWSSGPNMQIPRGYQASCTLSDGRTFVIGGSWMGGAGGKNGEVYDPVANRWTLLSQCPVAPMLTKDANGAYRADNHGWLFGWKNGHVFQAGPSASMNWYSTAGKGGQSSAGTRGNDPDAMCGNAVMYDAVNGKILALGGSPDYENSGASSNAHIITIGNPGDKANVQSVSSMAYRRIFANAVALPNGQVFVTGGQTYGAPFSDANAILTPEIWDPATSKFTSMASNSIPRNYHSFALLLPDATVISGGGGLCGSCTTNHFDAQIFTPPYLLDGAGRLAVRPVINTISSSSVALGGHLDIGLDSDVSSISMVRYGSATHSLDTDQRRIELNIKRNSRGQYTFLIPSDPGVALPGYWMVFPINSAGVPAVARTILVKP